jgi:phosphate transport system ATP-binding protein
MNDRVPSARVTKGEVLVKGKNIHDADVDLTQLRKQVGMVFQKSNPFPKSIYENVAYGLRIHGEKNKNVLDEAVERSLRHAALWDELKDRLHANALAFPAASSSVCASPAPSPRCRMCCSWTSPAPRSIPSRR